MLMFCHWVKWVCEVLLAYFEPPAVYSEVSSITVTGSYSKESVNRICTNIKRCQVS